MNTLNLEFVNLEPDFVVEIDGKICDFKKPKKNRNSKFEYQTENDMAHLSIKRFVPIGAKNWFFWQLLFFFVSVFGIFNKIENKKCFVIEYQADIKLIAETKVKVVIHRNSKDKKAVELLTEAEVTEQKNELTIDKVAKKRIKFIKIFTIVFWVLLLFVLGFVIVNLIAK